MPRCHWRGFSIGRNRKLASDLLDLPTGELPPPSPSYGSALRNVPTGFTRGSATQLISTVASNGARHNALLGCEGDAPALPRRRSMPSSGPALLKRSTINHARRNASARGASNPPQSSLSILCSPDCRSRRPKSTRFLVSAMIQVTSVPPARHGAALSDKIASVWLRDLPHLPSPSVRASVQGRIQRLNAYANSATSGPTQTGAEFENSSKSLHSTPFPDDALSSRDTPHCMCWIATDTGPDELV